MIRIGTKIKYLLDNICPGKDGLRWKCKSCPIKCNILQIGSVAQDDLSANRLTSQITNKVFILVSGLTSQEDLLPIWHCLVHNDYILFLCPTLVSKPKLISKPPVKANTFSSDLKKESRTKDIVEVEAAKKFSDLLLLRNQTDSREHQQHLPFYFYCHLGLPHIAICKENFWLIVCCMFKCTSAKQRSGEHCQQSG